MKRLFQSRSLTIFILMLIFLLPGLAAQYVYHHPDLIPAATTNKGHLVREQIKLVFPGDADKWHLAYWQAGQCETQCLAALDKLTRIRVALGRRYYQVDQWLLLAKAPTALPAALRHQLADQEIQRYTIDSNQQKTNPYLQDRQGILLISPGHDLVLTYAANVNPKDVFEDLKHLLKNQRE